MTGRFKCLGLSQSQRGLGPALQYEEEARRCLSDPPLATRTIEHDRLGAPGASSASTLWSARAPPAAAPPACALDRVEQSLRGIASTGQLARQSLSSSARVPNRLRSRPRCKTHSCRSRPRLTDDRRAATRCL